ncbi:hypothetical protein FJZ17_03475, partial [Candidatus Pacearchaeota archaeon]|nr:hypothetical protein [Candidatus Pacearchaeota archaeon]
MKTQIFTTLFLAVLFLSVVSVAAANYTLSSTSLKVNQPATTSSFAVTPTNSSVLSNYTITSGNFSLDDSSVVTVSGSSLTNINTTQTVNVSTSGLNYNKMSVGKTYSAILKVMDNNNEQQNVTASFERSFCDYGENGTWLEISDIEEDEDFEWNPL